MPALRPILSARAALVCLLLAACGSDGGGGGPDADPLAPDADPGAIDADPNAPDAAPPGPDATPPFPTCLETCSSPADCTTSTSPLIDVDNYACEGGRCRWTGCNSTQECIASVGATYVCDVMAGSPVPNCYQTCSTGSDCVIPGSPLYDADNWRCEVSKCRWVGCNSTTECTTALMSPNYTCAPSGAGFNTCWQTCSVAGDCSSASSPLLDDDNYTCDDAGICHWLGCNSTMECTDAYMSPDYVCEGV
jgi:hypothetical protein